MDKEYELTIFDNKVVNIISDGVSTVVYGGTTFYVNGIMYTISEDKRTITENTFVFEISKVQYKISYTDNVPTRIIRSVDGVVFADIVEKSFTMAVPYSISVHPETGKPVLLYNSIS